MVFISFLILFFILFVFFFFFVCCLLFYLFCFFVNIFSGVLNANSADIDHADIESSTCTGGNWSLSTGFFYSNSSASFEYLSVHNLTSKGDYDFYLLIFITIFFV
jgi:hypothetical protein